MIIPYFIAILLGLISPANSNNSCQNGNGTVVVQSDPNDPNNPGDPGDDGGDDGGQDGPGSGGPGGNTSNPPPKP